MKHNQKHTARGIIKNSLMTLFIMMISLVGVTAIVPTYASAAACKTQEDSNLLNFPTWYRGLCQSGTDKVQIEGGSPADVVFTIALNLIDIALRVVGILAVGYLVYGGFRYVMSRGSPEETKKAQDIILKAIIGLVIAILSTVIVSFVVSRLNP